MAERPSLMLWLDLETTGLDPATDLILEVGYVITDLEARELNADSFVIHQPDLTLRRLRDMEEVVREMHLASGLLSELVGPAVEMSKVQSWILAKLTDLAPVGEVVQAILAGNGVDHMDRPWLTDQHGLGVLGRHLTYWSIDPSVIRRSLELWGHDRERAEVAHRALPDCRQAIEEWKRQREWFAGARLSG